MRRKRWQWYFDFWLSKTFSFLRRRSWWSRSVGSATSSASLRRRWEPTRWRATGGGRRWKSVRIVPLAVAMCGRWEQDRLRHQTLTFTFQMDFHCRSRGHKVKKEEGIPCKKCDYIAENKDDSWVHKKVHIPPEKLFECGDCVWCVIIYYYYCCYFRYYKGAETDWTTSDTTSTLRSDSHPCLLHCRCGSISSCHLSLQNCKIFWHFAMLQDILFDLLKKKTFAGSPNEDWVRVHCSGQSWGQRTQRSCKLPKEISEGPEARNERSKNLNRFH